MRTKFRILSFIIICLGWVWNHPFSAKVRNTQPEFEKLSPKRTGINLKNQFSEDTQINILR